MSRLPVPSKSARPGGLVRPTIPPPSFKLSLPNDAAFKKRAPDDRPQSRSSTSVNLSLIHPRTAGSTPPPPKATNQPAPVTNAAPTNNVEQGPAGAIAQAKLKLQVGDRVLVDGAKMGFLKYIGITKFAKGTWAGIELDEAIGKNDGVVAGEWYFQCSPQHGLFTLLSRVKKVAGEALTPVSHPPASQCSPHGSYGVSPASSHNQGVPSPTLSSSSQSHALSEGCQQELDTRGLSLVEQVQRLTQLLSESEQRLKETHAAKEKSENEKEALNQQVSELTRKLEDIQSQMKDLQFQMEEEAMKKLDQLKVDSASILHCVTELEKQLHTTLP